MSLGGSSQQMISPMGTMGSQQQNNPKKSTMWDDSKSIFDISAGSLQSSNKPVSTQQNVQSAQQSALLTEGQDLNLLWNNPMMGMQQQYQQNLGYQ